MKCLQPTQWKGKSTKHLGSIILASVASATCIAQSAEFDDAFFDEIEVDTSDISTADGKVSSWHIKGSIAEDIQFAPQAPNSDLGFSRSQSGITQVKTTARIGAYGTIFNDVIFAVNASGFYDARYHQNPSDYSPEEFDNMADEIELRDTFIEFETFDNLWLKMGKQIVAWGESEFVQIADMVNPRDEREFGLVDLEDSRLPLLSTRVSYVGQRWGIDTVLIQEHKPNKYAGAGSDFDPLIDARDSFDFLDPKPADVGFMNPDIMVRGFYSHSRGDLSIVAGKTHAKQESVSWESAPNQVRGYYPEINTVGFATNYISGFWLLKGEVAYKQGSEFFSPTAATLFTEKALVQGLLGFEFTGNQDLQLSVELQVDNIQDHDNTLEQDAVESLLSSRVNFEFMRDTAGLEFVVAAWLDGNSLSLRTTYHYDISDSVKVKAGFISFYAGSEDGMLKVYENNDRIFTGISYSF